MPTIEEWMSKRNDQDLANKLVAVSDVNPDSAAQAVRQARENNIPAALTPFEPDPQLAQQAKLRNASAAVQSSKTLREWMKRQPDVVTASVQDDVDNMSMIDALFDNPLTRGGRAIASGVPRLSQGFYGAAAVPFGVLRSIAEPFSGTRATIPLLPVNPFAAPEQYFLDVSRGQKELAELVAGDREESGVVTRGIYSGLESLGQSIPALAAGVITKNPSVALSGLATATTGIEYAQAREKLDVGQAVSYATLQGAIEYATEKLPVSALLKDINADETLLNMLGRQILMDVPGEQAATVLQDLNEWANLNPDKPFKEYLAERPGAAAETLIATIVGVGGNVAITKGIGALVGRDVDAQKASDTSRLLNELNTLASASVVRQRDVETFEGFLQTVTQDTPVDSLFIDAQTLINSGLAEKLAQQSPAVAEQLPQAQAGTMIRIPTAEVMGRFNQDLAVLLPEMRTDPNGMSQKEADEYVATRGDQLRAEVESVLSQSESDQTAQEARGRVRDTVAQELMATGRVTQDVADSYALLTSTFYHVMGRRMGMDAEQLFGQERLRVAGAGRGEFEQGAARRVYLNNTEVKAATAPAELHADKLNAMSLEQLQDLASEIMEEVDSVDDDIRSTGRDYSLSEPIGFLYDYFERNQGSLSGDWDAIVRDFVRDNVDRNPKRIISALRDAGRRIRAPFEGQQSPQAAAPATEGQFNQTATVRSGRETLKKYGLKPGGKYKTRQVAAALEARQRTKYGSIAENDRSPEAISKIAKWMTAEVEFEMENPEKSGVGWYSEKFQRALDIMGDVFPELKTDKTARNTMTALIAITSDGQKVVPNFAQAMDIYGNFRSTGKFTTTRGHARQASINANLEVIQRLHDTMGAEAMHQYLMQERSISELKKIAKQNGGEMKSGYQAHIKMPMAAVEFGPKLGAFYANLMGAHGYLTMDRWWSRTFNRYRGLLLQKPTRQGLDRLKQLLGNPEMSDDEAIAATVEPRNAYEAKGFKNGTELEKAANTIYKAAFENLEDAPFNATDRTFMLDAVNRARQMLEKKGYKLSIADIQAILWYYEKRLYGELGARQTADISYEEAARKVATSYAGGSGVESVLDDAAAAPGDGGADAKGVSPGDELYQTGNQSGPGSEVRGSFSPAELTIRLTKARDLSTFLHESGHFYLHMLANLAARPDAPADVRQDANTVLAWMGVEDTPEADRINRWLAMSIDEQRAGHEKFARAFEVYLSEGKAPSTELQPMFARFRSWLLTVYKALLERARGNMNKALDAGLNDEVRAVFDRMLATQDEIENAEAARSMGMMFKTEAEAAQFGVDWKGYQAQGEAATQAAEDQLNARSIRDMKWLSNARSRLLKKLQREADEVRRVVRAGIRAEVVAEPTYRAWQFLTGKITKDDKIVPEKAKQSDRVDPKRDTLFMAIAKLGGLDKEDVVSTWGVDTAGRPITPMFGKPLLRVTGDGRKTGLTIDGMAETLSQYGYLTVDENGKWDIAEFEEKFDRELRGEPAYSSEVDPDLFTDKPAGAGVNLEGLAAGRFDPVGLDELQVGEEIIQALKARGMVSKTAGGIHPEFVAGYFGFSSGDELVRTLAAATPLKEEIERRTDERMLEQHSDLATPQAREAAVNEALSTEARARLVATELAALERAMNTKTKTKSGTQNTLPSAARQFAEAVIARLKVRDVRVGQYAGSASRAAKAADKARTKGNLQEAALEKRNQLVNTFAGKFAADAMDEVRKGVEYLRKFQNEGTRKNLDVDYLDQIDAILERYELKRVTNKGLDKRKALQDWLAEQEAMGITPDLPPHILNAAQRTNYRDLTVEEFRGLIDSVRQIEHFARLKKKLLLAKDQREFAEVVRGITESIIANDRGRVANNITRTDVGSRMARAFKAFTAAHRKMASIAYEIDGFKDGGPLWDALVRTANEQGNWEASKQAELTERLAALLKGLQRTESKFSKGKFFPGIRMSLNQEMRLTVALNWGNAGNRQRLLDGRGWSPQGVQEVLDTLTENEWAFVQGVWDTFESLRPAIAEKERRVMGKEPNWVEPTPVVTRFGTLRGGYFPAIYDAGENLRAEQDADAEFAKRQLQGARTAATTRRNFVKARADEVKGRPILLTMDGMFRGLTDVVHDLAYHEWLIDANRLLRAIDQDVRDRYGSEMVQQLRGAVEAIAAGEATKPYPLDAPLRHLRLGSMVAGLGFNLVNAMMQPLGLTQSVVRVGPRWMAQGLSEFAKNPASLGRRVLEKSEFMRNRKRTQNRELNDLRNRIRGQSEVRQFIDGAMFLPMTAVQMTVDLPTWWGAYQKALTDGVDEDSAVQQADQAVLASQGGGQMKDLAAVQRGPEMAKLFTVFYGYFSTAYNLGAERARATNFKNPAQVARLATDFLLLYSVPAVLGVLIKDAFKAGDDDEEMAKKLAAEQLSYLFGLMVGVREATGAAQIIAGVQSNGGLAYGGPAGLRFFQELTKFSQQANQGELDKALVRAGVNVGGIALHLPSAQINRTIDGVVAMSEGRTQNPVALIGGAPPQ
jgi:hypothetical protein